MLSKKLHDFSSLEESVDAIRNSAIASGNGDEYDYDSFKIGNLSYQRAPMCDGCFCAADTTCPDHPMLRRMVRWAKIIARSKHGMTVLFSIVPLMVGLLVGIYLGRKWEQEKTKGSNHKVAQQSSQKENYLSRVMHKLATCFYMLRAYVSIILNFLLTGQYSSGLNKTTPFQSTVGSQTPDESNSSTTERSSTKDALSIEERSQYRQSGVDLELVPKHIAVIMDGNRRYGKSKYKNASRGHVDGGYKLRDMVQWCIEECIQEMTVYAFSTENWNRSQSEIDALMNVFCKQCEELRKESAKLQIVVRVLSTLTDPIPDHVKAKLKQLEDDTRHCQGTLILNVCLSYGSRGEIVRACRSLAAECRSGELAVDEITEDRLESRLLTGGSPPPDILLRTSGEVRLSNFLLWQCAYTELFFLSKHWPDLEKEDLLEVIRGFANGRMRRFGA